MLLWWMGEILVKHEVVMPKLPSDSGYFFQVERLDV